MNLKPVRVDRWEGSIHRQTGWTETGQRQALMELALLLF